MCLPGFFQSQGHSAAATHPEEIDIGVQLITSFKKETTRNRNDGVVGSKVSKRGNHEGAIFCLFRGTNGSGQRRAERETHISRSGTNLA